MANNAIHPTGNLTIGVPSSGTTLLPGVYIYPDQGTGTTTLVNTNATAVCVPTYAGNTLTIQGNSTTTIQGGCSGPIYQTTAGTTTVAFPQSGTSTVVYGAGGGGGGAGGSTVWASYGGSFGWPTSPATQPGFNDTLMPRDELIFIDNPLTLTEENKQQIRAFVMEIPCFKALVETARLAMAQMKLKMTQLEQAKYEIKKVAAAQAQAAGAYMKQVAKAIYDPIDAERKKMRAYCAEHERQVDELIKAQERKLMKSDPALSRKMKWISMSLDSRSFASG